ncbi:unnamed protein product [Polarella glacialis]|uniref:Uncharacterized protein n=1 Tax=Polarella glacialis TaxID=89957 RepID=A0A813EJ40_POLGL|nr:unnamed protein product [Polarella glacialis]
MARIKMLVPVLLLAGLLSTTGASQATDSSCRCCCCWCCCCRRCCSCFCCCSCCCCCKEEEDSESSGLLQVSQLAAAGKSTATVGCAFGECCAPFFTDLHDPKYDGKCCEDLYLVMTPLFLGSCTKKCLACSKAGKAPYRFCGGCCGSRPKSDQFVPCCAGLTQKLVNGNYICV